ncbi:MAG: hypothetical protein KME52_03495 [Desmonostoc geniculatum HA4340-LM1]|nr:hypothetical protein [Desmonostoc geniculatum HA4340-LM1]
MKTQRICWVSYLNPTYELSDFSIWRRYCLAKLFYRGAIANFPERNKKAIAP